MNCINCFNNKTSVLNLRSNRKTTRVWRRRRCKHCSSTFTTIERPELMGHYRVTGSDSSSADFSFGRLITSIDAAFQHNPSEGKNACYPLALTIQDKLLRLHPGQASHAEIATIAHQTLRNYDEAAAMQYALQHQLIVSSSKRRGRPSLVAHDHAKQA